MADILNLTMKYYLFFNKIILLFYFYGLTAIYVTILKMKTWPEFSRKLKILARKPDNEQKF